MLDLPNLPDVRFRRVFGNYAVSDDGTIWDGRGSDWSPIDPTIHMNGEKFVWFNLSSGPGDKSTGIGVFVREFVQSQFAE